MKMLCLLLFLSVMTVNVSIADLETMIAHRGASFDAPENTAASIALAIDRGAKIIEFDVRETVDGKLLLFHDNDLKRLCNLTGTFEALSGEDAADLDVGSWFSKGDFSSEKPPSLSASITQCLEGGAIPLIEHKSGSPDAYAKVIKDLDAVDKVIVQSFDWKFIAEIRKRLPKLKVGALGSKKLSDRKAQLTELKPDWVGWNQKDITKADIDWLKEKSFHIAIWTVNDPARAAYLLDSGADKIITDRPKFLSDNLSQ